MIILQLSDLHATEPGGRVWDKIDSLAAARRAVDQALTLQPQPDIVLITGDLANNAKPEQYPALRAELERLPGRKLLIPGNHDDRAGLRQHFAGWEGLGGEPTAPIQYVADADGLRLIMLDSTIPGKSAGEIDGAACEFLDEALAAAPDTPTLIVQHHPPVPLGLHFMDAIRARPHSSYFKIMACHPQILAVLCGHYHRHVITRLGPVPLIVAPSTIASLMLDLRPDGPTGTIEEPPACLVHRLSDGNLVTHLWPIGDFGAPTIFA